MSFQAWVHGYHVLGGASLPLGGCGKSIVFGGFSHSIDETLVLSFRAVHNTPVGYMHNITKALFTRKAVYIVSAMCKSDLSIMSVFM